MQTELLPIWSSAHVIVAEKLMGLDHPSRPPMTLLLVMLHTGTSVAVIVYFWRQRRATYFHSGPVFRTAAGRVIITAVVSGIVGQAIVTIIERTVVRHMPHSEIEDLSSRLELMALASAAVGLLRLTACITAVGAMRRSLCRVPWRSS